MPVRIICYIGIQIMYVMHPLNDVVNLQHNYAAKTVNLMAHIIYLHLYLQYYRVKSTLPDHKETDDQNLY